MALPQYFFQNWLLAHSIWEAQGEGVHSKCQRLPKTSNIQIPNVE